MVELYETLIQGLLDRSFVSVDHWLSPDRVMDLRKSLADRYAADAFHLAGVGNQNRHQTKTDFRSDRIHWLDRDQATKAEKRLYGEIDGFVEYLNRTCYAGIQDSEFHYAVYEPGSFYGKHVDCFRQNNRRRYTMVFYLHEAWQPGDGGELQLYLGEATIPIQPKPGRVVFFDSGVPHEVLKGHIRRMSLTGWLKTG